MLIEAWLVAIIFALLCGIIVLTLTESIRLEDKLERAYKQMDSLREKLCEKEVHIEKLNRKLLVKKANEIYIEMGKK